MKKMFIGLIFISSLSWGQLKIFPPPPMPLPQDPILCAPPPGTCTNMADQDGGVLSPADGYDLVILPPGCDDWAYYPPPCLITPPVLDEPNKIFPAPEF